MSAIANKWWMFNFLIFITITVISGYVEVKGNTNLAVVGSQVNFSAVYYKDHKIAEKAEYQFRWTDNVSPQNAWKELTNNPYSNWTVTYTNTTVPGSYRITVEVDEKYIWWMNNVGTGYFDFQLTEDLNGNLQLIQDDLIRKTEFISTKTTVNHTIYLDESDSAYLHDKAVYVQTYWFQNCTYLGMSNGLSYEALYAQAEEIYDIEALVVASFEKLPDPTTSTTTTTTTTTSTTTTTTTSTTPTTTTPKPTTTTTTPASTTTTTPKVPTPTTIPTTKPPSAANQTRSRREVKSLESSVNHTAHATAALIGFNLTRVNTSSVLINPKLNSPATSSARVTHVLQESMLRPEPPYNCVNKTFIYRDQKKLYGYYNRKLITKNPVANFTSSGKNWLQHGQVLTLDIACQGSVPIQWCFLVFSAPYNATGNETCSGYRIEESCKFKFRHYFTESKTVLFFLKNKVSQSVNQVTINIYEAKKQSQLSVVVVPVAFTLIAVILIVFGVSYYVQSRNRFTVEVADFNFGETQSADMEYKTFHQRLIDSILEIIPRRQRLYTESSSSDIEPEPESPSGLSHSGAVNSRLRYDPMT